MTMPSEFPEHASFAPPAPRTSRGSGGALQLEAVLVGERRVARGLGAELVLVALEQRDLGEHLLLCPRVEPGGLTHDLRSAVLAHPAAVLGAQPFHPVPGIEDLADLVEVEAHHRLQLADA